MPVLNDFRFLDQSLFLFHVTSDCTTTATSVGSVISLISLRLSFLTYKIGLITIPLSAWGCCDYQVRCTSLIFSTEHKMFKK